MKRFQAVITILASACVITGCGKDSSSDIDRELEEALLELEKLTEVQMSMDSNSENIEEENRVIVVDTEKEDRNRLFLDPVLPRIVEKISWVDDINEIFELSDIIYFTHNKLIEDGLTQEKIQSTGSQYGGMIENYASKEEAIARAEELIENNLPEKYVVGDRLLIRISKDLYSISLRDKIISAIGRDITSDLSINDSADGNDSWAVGNQELADTSNIERAKFGQEEYGDYSKYSVPKYDGKPYIVLNKNVPDFTEEEKKNILPFERYKNLDSKGRTGVAFANLCKDLMSNKEMERILFIRTSGWQSEEYDFIDGEYLFNRCNLINPKLVGENANAKNLITGTRYMRLQGMAPIENLVMDYINKTNNHDALEKAWDDINNGIHPGMID